MPNGFFAMLFRIKYIRRWGIMNSVVPESLSTHSMEVAVVAHALSLIGNKYFGKEYEPYSIMAKAIYHDVPEIFTGDIPTPIKYFSSETKKAYDSVEDAVLRKLLESVPQELRSDYQGMFEYSDEEKKIIKAADKLCAYLKCAEEERLGNKEFSAAKKTLFNSIKTMECREANYFLDTFGDSFGLPIDTLLK